MCVVYAPQPLTTLSPSDDGLSPILDHSHHRYCFLSWDPNYLDEKHSFQSPIESVLIELAFMMSAIAAINTECVRTYACPEDKVGSLHFRIKAQKELLPEANATSFRDLSAPEAGDPLRKCGCESELKCENHGPDS